MITKNVTLWLNSGPKAYIPVSQFDTMWSFVFTIINGSVEWTIPDGASATLNGLKPDGNVFAFAGTIANNRVLVDCDVQMTAAAGNTICELSIISDGKTVGTANFVLAVEAAPKSPDDVSSESTLPVYEQLLAAYAALPYEVGDTVEEWLDDHPEATTTVQDGSITEAKLAPAVAEKLNVGGMSADAKNALLVLLNNVAYTDEHGQDYIDALRGAMFPPVSVSAVFNQGQNVVYDTDDLNALRQYLTVTATYEGGVTKTVTGYLLSGSLTTGTSTITASYGGKTDTFTVTVTHQANGLVDGTYNQGSAWSWAVSGGNVLASTWSSSNENAIDIPLQFPLQLHSGDVVKFSAVRDGGANANSAVSIGFNGTVFTSGGNFCPYRTTTIAKTVTLDADLVATSLAIGYGEDGRSFTLVLTVNGEDVFV